jgi:hypothetical protein
MTKHIPPEGNVPLWFRTAGVVLNNNALELSNILSLWGAGRLVYAKFVLHKNHGSISYSYSLQKNSGTALN